MWTNLVKKMSWLIPQAYRSPKMIGIILIGFASGLPLALTGSTLGIWLAEKGISKSAIGLFSLCGLLYSFKFLWSPLFDTLDLSIIKKLGRRSSWIFFIQFCLILSIIGLGLNNPSINLNLTIFFTCLVAFFSASHDIVIDAFRIESLSKHEQAAGASAAVLGYRLGMLFTTSGALFLSEILSWSEVYSLSACGILIGSISVFFMSEPLISSTLSDKSLKLNSYAKRMIIEPFTNFAARKNWLFILLFILLFKLGEAFLGSMMNIFFLELGFSKKEIASIVKTFGLVATLLGTFAGGNILYKLGLIKSLWITGILQMISNLIFIVQGHLGYNPQFLILAMFIENFTGGMASAVMIGYIGGLCNINYTATQFALLSSISSAGRTMFSSCSGFMVNLLGWKWYFASTSVICIPALLIIPFLKENSDITNAK